MVELDLEKPNDFAMDKVAILRRRISYKPSKPVAVSRGSIHRKGAEQLLGPLLPEWMIPQDLLPSFVHEISDKLRLSDKENKIHSALAGVLLWENFYLKYRDTLTSPQQMPSYLIEVVIPDLRAFINLLSVELSRDVFAASRSLERANDFITDTHRKGEYVKSSHEFFKSSPFLPLYRSVNRADLAPFHHLYNSVILEPAGFVHHSHDFFVNKDQSFFGWVSGNLKNYYGANFEAVSSLMNKE